MITQKDRAAMRMELWAQAWVNVARSDNCTSMSIPSKWADVALADFDKRFPAPPADNDGDKTIAKTGGAA